MSTARSPRALTGLRADDQAALDAVPDRTRRHAEQVPAGRQRDAGGVDGRGARRGGGARRAAVPLPGRRRRATLLPMPQIQIFGGGAHAGRRVDIQDFMVVCPGADSFAQALEWTAEVYRAAGQLMQRRGRAGRRGRRRRLVARLRHQRAGAGDAGAGHRERPATCRASRWPSRWTWPPPTSAAAAATGWGWSGASSTADGLIELLLRWCERYPDRLASKTRWPRTTRTAFARFTRGGGPPAAGGRRRLPGVAMRRCCARPPPRARPTAVLLKPNQRGTLSETLRVLAGRAGAGLCRHRLGALGRDRRHHHRPPGHRLGRGPAEGGLLRAQRAHGQVERGAAHRGAAGRARALCRCRRIRAQPESVRPRRASGAACRGPSGG